MNPPIRRARSLVPVVVYLSLVVAVACSGGGGDGEGEETEPGAVSAEEAITGFTGQDDGRDAGFRALHALERDDPDALRDAALERIDSTNPDVRFAAVYALSLTATEGPSAEALAGLLSAERTNERLLAAAGLLPLGRAEALPVLIEALDEEALLDHRDPPKAAWELARALLLAFTEGDFGLADAASFAEAAAAKPAWEAWWEENGTSLVYRFTGHRFEEGSA